MSVRLEMCRLEMCRYTAAVYKTDTFGGEVLTVIEMPMFIMLMCYACVVYRTIMYIGA